MSQPPPPTVPPVDSGIAEVNGRSGRGIELVRDALIKFGVIFLYRPDVTQASLQWLLGGPELFGYRADELEPTWSAFSALIHPRDALLVVKPRDAEALSGKSYEPAAAEYRIRHKSGEYIRIRTILAPFPPSQPDAGPAAVEMIRIIDERLSYERAATKLSEDALSTVLNQIGYPVILMNRAGLIVQANTAADQLCGAADVAERFCPFLHHADGSLLFPGFLEEVIRDGQPAYKELYRFERWWHVHLVPIRDSAQTVARVLLLAQDITSIKAAEEKKLEGERALTHTLIREIHHRIKNHLQGLVGLIRLNEGAPRTTTDLVNSVITQIQSIAAMHGLLARSGKSTVELSALVAEIVTAHRTTVHIPIRFRTALAPDFSLELAESEAIPFAVALNELITNATKHTKRVASAEILITLADDPLGHALTIRNAPARLPEDFHLPDWLAHQSGITLVLTLLSGSRFNLTFEQDDHSVTARITF